MKYTSTYTAKGNIKTNHNQWSTRKTAFALLSSAFLFAVPLTSNAAASQAKVEQNYKDSCAVCHASGALNAPKTGDHATWEKLKSKKGMDGLVKSVKNGVSQMPAGGLCRSCSDEDYRALINYMAK